MKCRIWKTVATEAVISGLKRCYTRCRGLYLRLRRRPMGRTDAPPYLPGASHLYGGGQRSWRWRRSGSPATEPSGPVTKLDPPDHLQPVLGLDWTQEANGGQNIRPLGGLISWLLAPREHTMHIHHSVLLDSPGARLCDGPLSSQLTPPAVRLS